ncbi:hypothetical protein QOZ80_9AG0670020 [Eleusine coracana subsp. coracana]|nr:hypothetical protein QOZ80_9AG0670020 [Eleusine coracana subsp. coracana]
MRRGGGGGRLPKSSLAPSEATPGAGGLDAICRNLDYAFNRRDSDAASLCSSRAPSSIGVGIGIAASSNFSDRATQAAALRDVNAFLHPVINLRPPLPPARDIVAAFRYIFDRLGYPLQDKDFEDDLLYALRLLGCPHKLTRSALKAPGTPHSWPPLLSVLYWLTHLANITADDDPASSSPFSDLLAYTIQGYSDFISGNDDAVAALDEEYVNKARTNCEEAIQATQALEKEAQEIEEKRIKLTSRRETLEAQKTALAQDVNKFQSVVETWSTKVSQKEEAVANLRKELDAKAMDAQRLAAENQDLSKKVVAQAVNVRDIDRIDREIQLLENDIAKLQNESATLEDKGWELDAALVTKFEELDRIVDKCNQALKKLKPSIDFQYSLNAKGSSPAELLGFSYKTKLKPVLKAYAEETKRISASKIDESVNLQKQLPENVKILEEKKNNISSLQDKNDEMAARLNTLEHEIENDSSRCSTDARQMKNELERKEHLLSIVEQEAADFLNNAEQRLQDALRKSNEETEACACELLELLESVAEYREFMEALIAQRKKGLNETADCIASLASKNLSSG